jgi:hypothetical protein
MPVVHTLAARSDRLRGFGIVGLMPIAAYAVHQLRYSLAYGSDANVVLGGTGHSYLQSVVPWLVALLALASGCFVLAVGRAWLGSRPGRPRLSLPALWLACSAALIAIFATQEFMEGLFASGHPTGLVGIFGYGGWYAIPLALCFGLVLACGFHGAIRLLGEIARRRTGVVPHLARPPQPTFLPRPILKRRSAPLADGWSGRGPPRQLMKLS